MYIRESKPNHLALIFFFAALFLPTESATQSNIDNDSKWAWQENSGWFNWRDADFGQAGVRIDNSYISGWIWMENVGWACVGDGAPGGVSGYSNTDSSDYGVNIDSSSNLNGYGWGENIGWINFNTAALIPFAQQARYDIASQRLRGYAWSENVGWINLDHSDHYVGMASASGIDDTLGQSYSYMLHYSSPNPFNPSTTISYVIPKASQIKLSVYDISGRLIKTLVDTHMDAGEKTAEWNGTDSTGKRVASGTYFLRLQTDQGVRTRKVTLAK